MMQLSSISILALLTGVVTAKQCMNATVPVTISARTGVFDLPIPHTNLEVTAFIQNQTKQGSNFSATALTGYKTTSGTYQISTQFCVPDGDKSNNPTVQLLTHGIGFDKTYWDLSYNNFNYSYVNVATDKHKYCTLSYDRLGIGNSSHGDPLNEIQASLEVAVLAELTMMLRKGTFPGVKRAFKKVVHVGHSFGSAQTLAAVAADPTISDGIALTGFSTNSSFMGYFAAGGAFVLANQNQPFRLGNATEAELEALLQHYGVKATTAELQTLSTTPYGGGLIDALVGVLSSQKLNYPDGYFASADVEAIQYNFLLPGRFDPGLLVVGDATKQPVTMGELLTTGGGPTMTQFTGPVLVFTGSADLPFCGGDCLNTGNNPALPNIPAGAAKAFPAIKPGNFEAYIQPETAHGLTFHYNATAGYDVINNFFTGKGLCST